MTGQTFDTNTIRLMTLFEKVTKAPVKDCIMNGDDSVCFIVEEGMIGIAIGKNGNSVRAAEKAIGKNIKLFEFSKNVANFVRHMIPNANSIKVRNEDGKTIVEIKTDKKNRAIVIGRDGKNLKLYREILKRNHDVDELIVK